MFVPDAQNNVQNGIFVPVCPVLPQDTEVTGFFGAAFRQTIPLLQARPMSARLIIVIPITSPASA
jgi:hypothetical protein